MFIKLLIKILVCIKEITINEIIKNNKFLEILGLIEIILK